MRPEGRNVSLAAMATEQIRDAILSGTLRLGEALSEEKLAVMLGISRTPVREALATLHMQGLITILPQRGSFVFNPTEDDVRELCEFRSIAETQAMLLSHARDRAGTLNRLRVAQGRMQAAHAAEDFRASSVADAAFHDALFEGCGNQFLRQSYAIIGGRISAVRVMLLDPGQTWRESEAEHDEIIAAFEIADLTLAQALLLTHIMKMRPRYRATLDALRLDDDQSETRRPRRERRQLAAE
jgi:DNA-binding GntR family transcriptional regulator